LTTSPEDGDPLGVEDIPTRKLHLTNPDTTGWAASDPSGAL
jgi:hypothetical protein